MIIAEDLGVMIPEAKKLLCKTGWPGMKVLQFAFEGNPGNPYLPHNVEENSVFYSGTHDNDTLASYLSSLSGCGLEFLADYIGGGFGRERIQATVRAVYQSRAAITIFQMQDFLELGGEARMNRPSTVGGNWLWRMTEEQFEKARGLSKGLKRLAFVTGR